MEPEMKATCFHRPIVHVYLYVVPPFQAGSKTAIDSAKAEAVSGAAVSDDGCLKPETAPAGLFFVLRLSPVEVGWIELRSGEPIENGVLLGLRERHILNGHSSPLPFLCPLVRQDTAMLNAAEMFPASTPPAANCPGGELMSFVMVVRVSAIGSLSLTDSPALHQSCVLGSHVVLHVAAPPQCALPTPLPIHPGPGRTPASTAKRPCTGNRTVRSA